MKGMCLFAGLLKPGGTVVEGTAGNTGIGLAHICNALGYKCVIFMPNTQSQVEPTYCTFTCMVIFLFRKKLMLLECLVLKYSQFQQFHLTIQIIITIRSGIIT